jgi:hypothetical protein
MTVKHTIARIAAVAAALALAAPALADPPQLLNDRAHYGASTLVAPDGWATKYAAPASGAAALHPDNGPRHAAPQPLVAVGSTPGSGFDWRAGALGALACALGFATVGTVVLRTRTRFARA